MLTIIGHDPGTKNYGLAIVSLRVDGKKVLYRVHKTCKMKSTADIKNAEMQKQLSVYLKEVKGHTRSHKPTNIIAERYMTRGIKGPLVESVNMMLGSMAINSKTPIQFVPAAVWKNRVNKFFDLKAFYKEAKVEAHEIDATLMTFYAAEKLLGRDILSRFAKAKDRKKLLEKIESCTTSQLKGTKKARRKKPQKKLKRK